MKDDNITDAEFEVITGPDVQWQPIPRPRLSRWVIAGRVLCVAIVLFLAIDLWTDGAWDDPLDSWLIAHGLQQAGPPQ